jgi:hypothetical protein
LDITGPLTIGGWYQFNTLGTTKACASKWTTDGNQRSYLLQKGSTDNPVFFVSGNGTAFTSVPVTDVGINAEKFVFMVGRFTPSTEIAVWGNDKKNTLVTGIPSSIFNSSASFNIGATENGTSQLLDGRAALCFLCASAVPDSLLKRFFTITRTFFGV